jgi:hypothetical protein
LARVDKVGQVVKNIQVIDAADNCTFSVFQATEDEFQALFPGEGQDIEFSRDLFERLTEAQASSMMEAIWQRPILKKEAVGIHGTLFFQFESRRKYFPETKREKDWNPAYLSAAQREVYARA